MAFVNGTAGNDLITTTTIPGTTNVADSVFAGAGGDTVLGGGGNDFLYGDYGNDSLRGGTGNDAIIGSWDNDTLHGDSGNDTLGFSSSHDEIGNDYLYGGSGFDYLYAGSGNDFLNGGSGNDNLDGGEGQDTITGGPRIDNAVDYLTGGSGVDVFWLGDYHGNSYSGAGNADYAVINDLEVGETVQLDSGNYNLGASPIAGISGTAIYQGSELIGILKGVPQINLQFESSGFTTTLKNRGLILISPIEILPQPGPIILPVEPIFGL